MQQREYYLNEQAANNAQHLKSQESTLYEQYMQQMAAKQQIEQKYKSSKQSKNSRGQSRKKHQSDMNNGVHMNGYKGQL